jgi:hypothetical protein
MAELEDDTQQEDNGADGEQRPPKRPNYFRWLRRFLPMLVVAWLVLSTCEKTTTPSWLGGAANSCGCKGKSIKIDLPGMERSNIFLCLGLPQ